MRREEKYLLHLRMVGREDLLGRGSSWQTHEIDKQVSLTGGRYSHEHSPLQGWGREANRESRGSGDGRLGQLSRLTLWGDKNTLKDF